jgi:hypothetical protein
MRCGKVEYEKLIVSVTLLIIITNAELPVEASRGNCTGLTLYDLL